MPGVVMHDLCWLIMVTHACDDVYEVVLRVHPAAY